MNNKPFYKKPSFYLAVAALIFTIIAIALYVGNCGSEFNGNKPSSAVAGWESVALVMLALAVAADIADYFIKDGVLSEIFKFSRFLKYVAFISLVIAFFMQILDEYSLLGTILYPIVSGTVGDPVEHSLVVNYFTSIAFAFVAVVVSIVSALMQKFASYRVQPVGNADVKEDS